MLEHVKKKDISLVIIDSIAMLYRLELSEAIGAKNSEKISEVNRNLANQLRTLNEIARKQNIPSIPKPPNYILYSRGLDCRIMHLHSYRGYLIFM